MAEERKNRIKEFENELSEKLEDMLYKRYGKLVDIEPKNTIKTNGEKPALIVRFEDSPMSPTLYSEELFAQYVNGKSIDNIVNEMSEVIYNAYVNTPEMPELTIEEAIKHIKLNVINSEMNKQLLEDTPHFNILEGELSAIPRWYVSDEASFIVKNNLVSQLGMTPEEVLQIGQHNINNQEYVIQSMNDLLQGMLGMEVPTVEEPKMLVITSERMFHGANALLSDETLKQVFEEMGEQRYAIIPSSVNEIIALEIDENMNPVDIRSLICEVNSTIVEPEEVLSNQLIMYDGNKLSLVGNTMEMESPEVDMMKFEKQVMTMSM